jgi:hypothetical protein
MEEVWSCGVEAGLTAMKGRVVGFLKRETDLVSHAFFDSSESTMSFFHWKANNTSTRAILMGNLCSL